MGLRLLSSTITTRPSGTRAIKPGILVVEDLEFDRDALIVKRAGKEITLTSLEYALLEFLMVETGKMVSRARILENVWGTTDDPLTNVVDVYIRRLRAHHPTQLIKTVRGRGYRLSA